MFRIAVLSIIVLQIALVYQTYVLLRCIRKRKAIEQHHRDVMAELHFILKEVYKQLPVQEDEAGDGISAAMQIVVTELKGRPGIRASLPLSRRIKA